MNSLHKDSNGHCMEIKIYEEMGGALDELIFWCHTCDPKGEFTTNYALREIDAYEAMLKALDFAGEHSAQV